MDYNQNKSRSRGPEVISEMEYEEICREEDKKMLDSTWIEPNNIDEFSDSSNDIISETYEQDNFDFPIEDKEIEPSIIQKVKRSKNIELEDNEKYFYTIKEIKGYKISNTDLEIVNINYDVKLNEAFTKLVEDSIFLDKSNPKALSFNLDKLDNILEKYNITIDDGDYYEAESIAKAMQCLINKTGYLIQKTKGKYKNYEIVSVISNEV